MSRSTPAPRSRQPASRTSPCSRRRRPAEAPRSRVGYCRPVSAPHIHDSGEGPVLLLLHAFPLYASQGDAQGAALSGRYRCLRPDFWGCGASPPPPAGVTVDSYTAAVLGALGALGVDDFSVCGVSMGGYMCFSLLRQARPRVRSVALVNTRAAADGDLALAARAAMAGDVRAGGQRQVAVCG